LIHVLDKREITTSARQIAGPHKPVVDVEDKIREALDNGEEQVVGIHDDILPSSSTERGQVTRLCQGSPCALSITTVPSAT